MFPILHVLWLFVVDIFKSRGRLEAENLFLHHQLNIALRRAPPRLRLYGSDRALLVWMTRICPGLLDISRVVKPETILRWHRSTARSTISGTAFFRASLIFGQHPRRSAIGTRLSKTTRNPPEVTADALKMTRGRSPTRPLSQVLLDHASTH